MPAWNDLLDELESQPDDATKAGWIKRRIRESLEDVRRLRGDRNVILYGSAFLQKPAAPQQLLQLTHEEINGFMSVMYGMDWADQLTLILHTPGGITNAAETLVSYLRTKFDDIEIVVPTFAMSAGTMISLSAHRLVLGRQSQLGPIDPQMVMRNRPVSARSIVDQFERAKGEILANQATAMAWAPVLQTIGPALLQEAQNALEYGEEMVARWLETGVFNGDADAEAKAKAVAAHFNDASTHKSHGRRIDRAEARSQGLVVLDLEDDQDLQDAVLTAYHVMTLIFEKTPAAKIITTHAGRTWIKNLSGN